MKTMKDKNIEQIIRETTEEKPEQDRLDEGVEHQVLDPENLSGGGGYTTLRPTDQGDAHRAAGHLRVQRAGRHARTEGHTGTRIHGRKKGQVTGVADV